ncbi:hypothetical protein [Streptomyces sp. JNUCC 63]
MAMDILAAGATRKITEMTAGGTVPAAELVDAARLEGQAATLSRALSVLAQPHARHPKYRQERRPRG